jgi:hypothetical protein
VQERLENFLMENSLNHELVEALQGIHDEMKRMNQTLAKMSTKSADQPATPARSTAGPGRPSYGASSGSRSYTSSAPRGGKAPYSRASRPAEDGEEGSSESFGNRFPKKKPGSTRSAAGPGRPKGKLPPKKGNGYPKKPR